MLKKASVNDSSLIEAFKMTQDLTKESDLNDYFTYLLIRFEKTVCINDLIE